MFEIGSSLRDARVRQGLDLSQAEHDTRIRARYLGALEDERFDLLPGDAYARGFLRTYADYLGLDPQRFVDEYSSRFRPAEEPAGATPVRVRRRRGFDRRLVAVPIAVLVALIVWRLVAGGGGSNNSALLPPVTQTHASAPTTTPTIAGPARPAVTRAHLVLVAARGPCWISVRTGSATGRLLFERTLQLGQSARFAGRRLWLRAGAPSNLDATVNGRAVALPAVIGDLVATPAGIRPAVGG